VAYEDGAAPINASIQFAVVDDTDGLLDLATVATEIAGVAHHRPEVSAICVENTHMPSGGRVWDLDRLEAIYGLGLPVHLDGARLFNAEVASGVSAATFAAGATTVMSCLSKGLGAPVGSILAGPAELIDDARRWRRRMGGAMRQAGVIAAAGLVALEEMVDRLADDHVRARRLAAAVAARWPGSVDPHQVMTNIVVARLPDPDSVVSHLAGRGVRAGTIGPGVLRLVTHFDVDDAGVDAACDALADAP
jgi:threonine aldolase